MENAIRPELAHDRFVEMDSCADCGYAETTYTAAKAVVADYFGVADGQPHTVTVSDLSEAGVTTGYPLRPQRRCLHPDFRPQLHRGRGTIRFTMKSPTPTTIPTWWRTAWSYVHLRDETTAENGSCSCGCGDPDCGCQDPDCDGCCCEDKGLWG